MNQILIKSLNRDEILEVIGSAAVETIPKGEVGVLHLEYNDDNGIEIYFISSESDRVLN